MPVRRFYTGHPYDAVIALAMANRDEAAIALRATRGMRSAGRKRMQLPRWRYQGSIVSNTTAQDELCTELCAIVAPGRRCLLCTDVDSRAGSMAWMHLGRVYGAVESLLAAANCYVPDSDYVAVTPKSWTQEIHTRQRMLVRDKVKQSLAQSCCLDRYPLESVTEPMARAILIADHVIMSRGAWQ